MRHLKANVKLGRTATHRKAMLRNMATSLFDKEKIVTTLSKAKAVRPLIDHIVTLAKRGDLHSIRQAAAVLTRRDIVKKLFDLAQERFGDRASGYTTMIKLGLRKGDVATMVALELVKPGQTKASVGGQGHGHSTDRSKRVAASRVSGAATETAISPALAQGATVDSNPEPLPESAAEIKEESSENQNSGEESKTE